MCSSWAGMGSASAVEWLGIGWALNVSGLYLGLAWDWQAERGLCLGMVVPCGRHGLCICRAWYQHGLGIG
jgi:hypothetical protein